MNRRQARYLKLRDKLTQAESDLLRATRKWDKLRQQVKRAERALDQEFNARSAAGKLDWRDFSDELVQCPDCRAINGHEENCGKR